MNISKTIVSIAVASMVGTAGYAIAQQTNNSSTYRDGTSAGTNNTNGTRGVVGGSGSGVVGQSGTTDSSGRLNNNGVNNNSGLNSNSGTNSTMRDGTTGSTSGTMAGERVARADRN